MKLLENQNTDEYHELMKPFKEWINERCNSLPQDIIKYQKNEDLGIDMAVTRDKLHRLPEQVEIFNNLYKDAMQKLDQEETDLSYIETLAKREILNAPELKSERKTTNIMESYIYDVVINFNGKETTYLKQKIKKSYYNFAVEKFKAVINTLEKSQSSLQSCLKADMEELKLV